MRIPAVLTTALLVLLGSIGAANAAPDENADDRAQEAADFWTVGKVRQAKARDLVYDRATGGFAVAGERARTPHAKGGKGGGGTPGGGGGDSGSTAVTGAPWESGGAVASATGKVLFELGGDYWVCSATAVEDGVTGRTLVLTAAHCVFDNEIDQYATQWVFVPDYDSAPAPLDTDAAFCDQTAHGCWAADALVLHDEFSTAGGFTVNAVLHDFAFAVTATGGHSSKTLDEVLTADLPGVAFAEVGGGTAVAAFGYPAAEPYTGDDLTYCAGPVGLDNRLFKMTYKLDCTMTGGSSGGGWQSPFDATTGTGTLMSVNSYGYSSGGAMHGPKFTAATAAVYGAALAATADASVN